MAYTYQEGDPGQWVLDNRGKPVGMTDAKGNAGIFQTVTTNTDGSATLQNGGLPNGAAGLSWFDDTTSGFDMYQYLDKSPTIFFDPTSTRPARRGTYKSPYTTQADLMGLLNSTNPQNMSSQRIGLMRGMKLKVGGDGLILYPYSSTNDPLIIMPYGDAEALPIISGEETLSGWGVYSGTRGHAGCIYSIAYLQVAQCFYHGKRLRMMGTTGNPGTSSPASLVAAGQCAYATGTIYVRLPDEADPDTVGDTLVISGTGQASLITRNTLGIYAPAKASSGTVKGQTCVVAGLDIRYGNNNCIRTGYVGMDSGGYAAANAAIDVLGEVTVMGCRLAHAGTDTVPKSNAVLSFLGLHDTKRNKGNAIGNYIEDGINNAVETTATDGGALGCKFNYSTDVGGSLGIELWASSSNWEVMYNRGYHASSKNQLQTSTQSCGAWIDEIWCDPADGSFKNTTAEVSTNNIIAHNIFINTMVRFFRIRQGAGNKIINNTCIWDNSLPIPNFTVMDATAPCQAINTNWTYANHTPAAGWLEVSNNLFVWRNSPTFFASGYLATERLPVGDNNIYLTANGHRFRSTVNDVTTNLDNATAYHAAFTTYDANAKFTSDYGGTLTYATELGLLSAYPEFIPTSASTAYQSGKTGYTVIGARDVFGRPYNNTTPNIGANQP
jgi:hypothetical protein